MDLRDATSDAARAAQKNQPTEQAKPPIPQNMIVCADGQAIVDFVFALLSCSAISVHRIHSSVGVSSSSLDGSLTFCS